MGRCSATPDAPEFKLRRDFIAQARRLNTHTQPSAIQTTRGRSELRALLRLAWPMMLTQLFIMGTGFLDTMMSGRYSAVDLGGVAMAGNVLWPCFMLIAGISTALTPIVSQLRGAGTTGRCGERVRQGLWLASAGAMLLIAMILSARPLLTAAGIDTQVIRIAMEYLQAVAWGVPAVVLYVTLRNVCDGLGETRPAMYISAFVLPINAALNYAFVYGKFGFPELGGVGCGWATAIVLWLQLGLMVLVVRQPFFRRARVFQRFDPPNLAAMLSILRLGLPIGVGMFLGMAIFAAIGFLIGGIGVNDLAAHSIAGNLNWLTYVIPMGLGAAASIRVGYFTGARELASAGSAALTAYKFAFVYALLMSAFLIVCRDLLVGVYTTNPAVIDIATTLLIFIAIYQIVDDTQAVAVGALRGYKDTTMPMVYQVIGYWMIALPLGIALAHGSASWQVGGWSWAESGMPPVPALGVYGYWTGLTIGLFLVTCANTYRLWRTSNDASRVLKLAHA